ncbi:3'-5' exonuclease [Psychrobacillus sp. AK 1817]
MSGEEQPEAVRLMTIHQSKSLEFPVVFTSNISRFHDQAGIRHIEKDYP